jgi:chromosome segregation ATPase
MKPFKFHLAALAVAAGMAGPVLRAADPAPTADDRTRAELRDTMLQLRSAQSDLATLQAQAASAADEKTALAAKNESLRKQLAASEASGDKTAVELRAQIEALKSENSRLATALSKKQSEADSSSGHAQDAETRAAHLRSQVIVLTRKVADLESKNLALFLTGNEILTRYQDFGLGTAIQAKEPFVGATRTRLENLVQDYQDKLADQRSHN